MKLNIPFASLLLICLYSTSYAGDIYVDRKAAGAKTGVSWEDAYKALQPALEAAVEGDTIHVAEGTYKPTFGADRTRTFQLKNNVKLMGGYPAGGGGRDYKAYPTILSGDLNGDDGPDFAGNAENSYHVVTGSGTASSAVLNGFIVTGGNANKGNQECPGRSCGGGIQNDGGSLTLRNVTFSGNAANWAGGGMANSNGSSPALINVDFIGNEAVLGGGMINDEYANIDPSSPTLYNVTFNRNTARYVGGGMVNANSNPILTNVSFIGNKADSSGGGMENDYNSSPVLFNVSFKGNKADAGGGMYTLAGHPSQTNVTLTNVTFVGNSAYVGGGMYTYWDSSPTLTNVSFIDNEATTGGAMYTTTRSNPRLTNVTFSGNRAVYGGAMRNSYESKPILTNVTISRNSATYGGAIYNYEGSASTIWNTLFWKNTADHGGRIYNDGTSSAIVNNSVLKGGCPIRSTCTGIISEDPLIGSLGDYGGSTLTVPLRTGSSALNAGNDSVCPDTDQRGIPRPQGAKCDIGAFEGEITWTCTHAPRGPDLIAPPDNANLTETPVELKWRPLKCANTYRVSIREGSSSGPIIESAEGLTGTSYFTWEAAPGKSYWWRVRACNQFGCRSSEALMFTIK